MFVGKNFGQQRRVTLKVHYYIKYMYIYIINENKIHPRKIRKISMGIIV